VRLTIFGTGYVGLVTGACLAEVGNHVLCVDVDADKVARLNAGEVPIYEPGLERLVAEGRRGGRLAFTTDAAAGVAHAELLFIAVGTPPEEDGSADLSHVLAVARTIGTHLHGRKIVVDKSTVPVGTADAVAAAIAEVQRQRGTVHPVAVVSNPEFLKEGDAVNDFMRPDRIILGCSDPWALEVMRELYAPFNRNHQRLIEMDPRSAELTKYAANAMLATKISFMNELAALAERVDADIEKVRIGIGSDPRIGYHFIYPGLGYGGSCFPKDVRALAFSFREQGIEPRLLDAVEARNRAQRGVLFDKILSVLAGTGSPALEGRRIALWGLAFKPNTDDLREAAALGLIEALVAAGAQVTAFDPVAMPAARRWAAQQGWAEGTLRFAEGPEAACDGADALAIATEWKVFRSPDFAELKSRLKQPLIFDGRNLYDPVRVRAHGFAYFAMGRPQPSRLEVAV